ncbi:hypothetical protein YASMINEVIRUS_218 [Yasminevirus sp. GU-2018]|uniref:Uncharacterized protein n=1 Tax=Yasminevirus sp. GU-2018 TaxID=2420051 RepID=A0A5K0U7L5_9VIRU|nr:hypothetical protein YASMINEVIRUS_218 [Yasminevirus sp. GU-2018]
MGITTNIAKTMKSVFMCVRFIVTEWIMKIVLPLILCIPIEIKNVIEVFILKHPYANVFGSSIYNIKNKTPEECEKELDRILKVIEQHPDTPIEVFLSDMFIGKPIKEISMRDLDTAVREYLKCGFSFTKRILKLIHKKGHYLDDKKYTQEVTFIDVNEPLDRFYRPCAVQIIRDFTYIANSIVGCTLGYVPEVTSDDIVIWRRFISKDRPTLLLIPSTYGFTMLYHSVFKAVGNKYNIVCIDTPNIQLRSGKVVNVETIVKTVTSVIKHDEMHDICYLGHSFGCIVLNQIFEKNYNLINKIVLIEPPILMGINSKLFYNGKEYEPNMLLNHVYRFTQSNRYLSTFYKTVFKADHIVLNTFKSFGHLYNIFPSNRVLDMMRAGNVVIVLSKEDIIIDYEVNKNMCTHLGAHLIVSSSHHGMAVADPHAITEFVKLLTND